MKKNLIAYMAAGLMLLPLFLTTGCFLGDKKPSYGELVIGSWNRYWNKSYFLLIVRASGGWSSDVRVEGASSRIIGKKGSASGTWKIEGDQLVVTVEESDIPDVWEKDKTFFYQIVEMNKNIMTLKYPNNRVFTWKRSRDKSKDSSSDAPLQPVIRPQPFVVNLDKTRSHDKDRYFCLALDIILEELMPDQKIPLFHPKAREAALMFLSSLTYKEVKTFDSVKEVNASLTALLNPYFNGLIKDIKIRHVVIASTMEKVEEFLIEHTPSPEPLPDQGETEKKEES